jgi:hydroxymethylglutaryl-CoA lyase
MSKIKIIECPRDAMQGIKTFIPTELKAKYINKLLKVGFASLDFGSFVSPKATPQMRDTAELLEMLDLENSKSDLLSVVASRGGAKRAIVFEQIKYLGFPLSISETFQYRNTRKTITESFEAIEDIQNLCLAHNKELVVYLSMAFGNPYGDLYNEEILSNFTQKLDEIGIGTVLLSDTIGVSDSKNIKSSFETLIPAFPHIEIGSHFHSNPNTATEKVLAAYQAGCTRFDGAIKGYGGCPMAKDDLTGNIATETMIDYFVNQKLDLGLDLDVFGESLSLSDEIFGVYH